MNRIILTLLLMGGIYTVMRGIDVPQVSDGSQPADVVGVAHVHDGDSLTIAGVKIRLFGVDAPEMDQNCQRPDGSDWDCGRWSRDEVRRITKGADLRCVRQDTDKYGRMVARCFLGDQDLAEQLVRDGVVFSYPQYSHDYIALEKTARGARRGLWAAKTIAPAEFRRQKREN